MTQLQAQAYRLIDQLPEEKLAEAVITLKRIKNTLTTSQDSPETRAAWQREFKALRAESSKYPMEDIETARKAALAEKYHL